MTITTKKFGAVEVEYEGDAPVRARYVGDNYDPKHSECEWQSCPLRFARGDHRVLECAVINYDVKMSRPQREEGFSDDFGSIAVVPRLRIHLTKGQAARPVDILYDVSRQGWGPLTDKPSSEFPDRWYSRNWRMLWSDGVETCYGHGGDAHTYPVDGTEAEARAKWDFAIVSMRQYERM